MDSLTFRPGLALLQSHSVTQPWSAFFEDEGPAGYFYAADRSLGVGEEGILDAMLIYNGPALEDRERERLVAIEWSRDGQRAVLYLDGVPQAFADFAARQSFCRTNFPNFLDGTNETWLRSSHAWNDEAIARFEAELYA